MLRFVSVSQLAALLVATCLSAAQAQDDLRAAATGDLSEHEEVTALRSEVTAQRSEITELRSEVAQLRSNMMTGELPGVAYGGNVGCDRDGGCGSSYCCQEECGCDCWCGPACSCGFYGGAELFVAQPRWRGFDAVTVTTGLGLPRLLAVSNTQGFDYDYEPTARFFVGYTGCNGLGLRSSWWEFDHDAKDISVTVPAPVPFFSFFVNGPCWPTLAPSAHLAPRSAPSNRLSCKPGTSRPRVAFKPVAATSWRALACDMRNMT